METVFIVHDLSVAYFSSISVNYLNFCFLCKKGVAKSG
ncbi:hypothetical protein CSB69_2246 [Morganella morganii]|nr:hypothetical protein CSB69_2246 [Morganella morganii]